MRIGELAAATGVDPETIRYYEREKLLAPPQRQANGYRVYGKQQLERLAFIRHCRALDIPLADIRRLIDFLDQPGGDCGDIDRLIEAQLARVQARLQSMRALERQLTELRTRCDSRHTMTECGILHELVAAAHGEACVCHGGSGLPVQKI
jgi:Cd(II)/Pb(II)-responsive transcriptional regulator